MAEIREWRSATSYDEELEKLNHYMKHPEMKPFIGTNYDAAKILLVGESHYIEDIDAATDAVKNYYNTGWYETPLCKDFPNQSWFNTREVVHNFSVLRRGKGHGMFRNPAVEMIKIHGNNKNLTDSDAFNHFAFMNYFQRPASQQGDSISNNDEDNAKAFETLNGVIDIIKPKKVIFLSKKAYTAYTSFSGENHIDCFEKTYWTVHPTAPSWHGNDGREKFDETVKDLPIYLEDNIKQYSIEALKTEIEKQGIYNIVKTKKFGKEESPTSQLYPKDVDIAKEIVIRFLENEKRRIGFGYRFDYRFIWAWDYDKKEYFDPTENVSVESTKRIYNEFVSFIENL